MRYDEKARRPVVGSVWVWEPTKRHAAVMVHVSEVIWNGEEWWIRTHRWPHEISSGPFAGAGQLNDLDRFWEACHAISVRPGPWGTRDTTRGRPTAVKENPA